jgi:formiminoglutamase
VKDAHVNDVIARDQLQSDASWPRASAWLGSGVAPGDRVDLAVLGVPTWRTSLSATRAGETPGAVRAALVRFSTWSSERQVDITSVRVRDHGDVIDPDSDVTVVVTAARAAIADAVLLVAIGGDNSLTHGVMRGTCDLSTAGLVTLDAHHDLRDGRSNGSPVRELIDAGLRGSRVVQIGIADFANSAFYARRAAEYGIRVVTRAEVERRGIDDVMVEALEIASGGGGDVHVDLDVDVCDRSVAPACPASLPGGLSAAELRRVAFAAGAATSVRSIDIAEIDATADASDGRTVRLGALCLLEAAAGLATRD